MRRALRTAEMVRTEPQTRDREAPDTARRWVSALLKWNTTWILLILVAMIAVFSALQFDYFLTVANFRNIATDGAILLILAVGATYVLITGGVDLSNGSVLVFSGVVAAMAMSAIGGDNWGAVGLGGAVAVAAGCAWGCVNGFVVTRLGVPPLIATLGTLGMALGLALVLTNGADVRNVPSTLVTNIGIGRIAGIPVLVWIAAILAIVFGILLARTRFGRYTYAVGSNVDAASRAGINVRRHLMKVYALSGALSGLAGFLSLGRFATTTLMGHSLDNLQAISAAVLGGTSLFGGVGAISGTVVGTFIPVVMQNGFVIIGIKPFWQQVTVGVVLILAVYFDQLRRKGRST